MNYVRNVQSAFRETMATELVGLLPELGLRAMPLWLVEAGVAGLVLLFGPAFLQSNDRQQTIARLLALPVPVDPPMRRLIEAGIEEAIEGAVRMQTQFGQDRDANRVLARQILNDAFNNARAQLGIPVSAAAVPAAAPAAPAAVPVVAAAAPAAAAPAAAAPAAPAAVPVVAAVAPAVAASPLTPNHNVLHLVGTVTPADSQIFWQTVAEIQNELNQAQQQELARTGRALQLNETPAGSEVTRLINRVSITAPQFRAIIGATTPELRRELLLSALRSAGSAGGPGSGLGRIWDRVVGMAESAIPTGGNSGNALEDLRANNARRAAEDDDVAGIR